MLALAKQEIDETAVVAYNGYDDLVHYYSEMSPLGDIPLDEYYNETLLATNSVGKGARIHNVSIPLLVIHALDDPLITWRTVAANRGFLHPSTLTKSGTGNLFVLLTKAGGHVGWPMGWNPREHRWKWMSNVAKDFIQAAISDQTPATNDNDNPEALSS
jgi:predicted alpha/beta-fold hydrolase